MAYRLTLLSRPPLFDEAPLLHLWAARSSWPVLIQSLIPGQNDPQAFLRRALDLTLPLLSAEVSAFLVRPADEPVATVEDAITALLNTAATVPVPFAWVLQNYDAISTVIIHEAMSRILDYAPPQMHVYATVEQEPPLLNLPRLRVRRQLYTVNLPAGPACPSSQQV